jgi:hypothetical protein
MTFGDRQLIPTNLVTIRSILTVCRYAHQQSTVPIDLEVESFATTRATTSPIDIDQD